MTSLHREIQKMYSQIADLQVTCLKGVMNWPQTVVRHYDVFKIYMLIPVNEPIEWQPTEKFEHAHVKLNILLT